MKDKKHFTSQIGCIVEGIFKVFVYHMVCVCDTLNKRVRTRAYTHMHVYTCIHVCVCASVCVFVFKRDGLRKIETVLDS